VSVYGTGALQTGYEVFLGGMDSISYPLSKDLGPSQLSVLTARRIFLPDPPTTFDQHIHRLADLSFRVTPSLITSKERYRNINLFSIDYAFRPHLRTRLTLGGRTFPRKPWAFGVADSHRHSRYLCRQSHFPQVHRSSRSDFNLVGTLPYHHLLAEAIRSFGTRLEPRYIIGAEPLDQWAITLSLKDGCF